MGAKEGSGSQLLVPRLLENALEELNKVGSRGRPMKPGKEVGQRMADVCVCVCVHLCACMSVCT